MEKTNLKGEKSRILWAVDPFDGDPEVLKSAAWSLRALTRSNPSVVEPVYVLATTPPRSAPSTDSPVLRELRTKGQEEMEDTLSRVKISGLLPLKILSKSLIKVRDEARELVDYAKTSGASLIVVSSHARKGLKRLILGSFAETLSLYSDVPLLVVHPNWHRTPDFKSILFLTDFSAESLEAFDRVLDFAEKQGSRVTLFHKPSTMAFPVYDLELAAAYYAESERLAREERHTNELLARKLIEKSAKRGVRVGLVMDRSRGTSVSDALLKLSRKKGGVIAMASHSGPVSTVLLGSTTRQVMRLSEQPVWVIHPFLRGEAEVGPLYVTTGRDAERDARVRL